MEGLKSPQAIDFCIKIDLWRLIDQLFSEGEQPDALEKEERGGSSARIRKTENCSTLQQRCALSSRSCDPWLPKLPWNSRISVKTELILLMKTQNLINHRLLRLVDELGAGMSQDCLAIECGYCGRVSGRPQVKQFQEAIRKANEEIEYDFGINVKMSNGINEFTSITAIRDHYPQLLHLASEEATSTFKLTAYFKRVETLDLPLFFIASRDGVSGQLISDLRSFNDRTKGSPSFAYTVLSRESYGTPKSCSDELVQAFSMTDADISYLSDDAHPRLLMACLAGCIYARISESLDPKINMFLPRNYGSVVAGYRPTHNDIWERKANGTQLIDPKIVEKLLNAKSVISLNVTTGFPVSSENIRIPGWKFIEKHLDEYWCYNDGLEVNDRLDWHLLFKLGSKG
ncbi:hypothetical protein [Synechococcus sp. BMK-MC-1]|uniref:hypothetical protein n=1 Tax=Synechococcus sp. BMK-MC-1 TaxID=1442551 RepID=UPI0016442EE2|nr:hypothetical protein [Synechococcus sp. BMK-MC-1]QNI68430.1 hypothetical protein SynBMKMC1_02374 [Synechococcus sp. BMK-MC-1]